jgi:hypothetical protein
MHRRFSHRHLTWIAPLVGALTIAAFPAVAEAATPATACTAVPASSPCYTAAPAIVPPVGAPAGEVSSPKVGIFLQVNPGAWTPAQPFPSVQWTQDCNLTAVPASLGTPISGAINRTYQISDSDAAHTLCVIFDTGGVEALLGPTGTVAPSAPFLQSNGAPSISGPTVQGQMLTANPGLWRGSGATTGGIKFTYQWKRCNSAGGVCGKAFTAPNSLPTYVLQAADVGHTMQVVVTATNATGSTPAGAKKATAVVVAPPNAPTPPSNPSGPGGNPSGGHSGGQTGGQNGGQGGSPSSGNGNSAKIRALLANALAVHGKGAKIHALLKHGGYSFGFAAPSRGRLVISWYRVATHGKSLLVAKVTVSFRKTGPAKVTLVLTGKGRTLLSGMRKMKLTAKGSFTPVGQGAISASKGITLTP